MLSNWTPTDREGRRAETGNACGLDTVKETTVAGFFSYQGPPPIWRLERFSMCVSLGSLDPVCLELVSLLYSEVCATSRLVLYALIFTSR